MYHNVLEVFHDVLLCLTMFYDVERVEQRSASATTRPPIASGNRDHDNAAGIGDNAAENSDDTVALQGSP